MHTAQELMRKRGETMRTADSNEEASKPDVQGQVEGVGGYIQDSNESASKADAQIDVTGVGSTGVSDVSAESEEDLPTADAKSDDSGFNTDKNVEAIPTQTYPDKDGTHPGVGEPVTHEPFPASEDGVKAARTSYDDKTLEQNEQQGDPVAQGGSAVRGVSPVDPVATESYDRVNVLEHQTTPDNNSGPTTTWSGTDGNKVLRQVDPVTGDKQEWGGVPVPDVQLHTTNVETRMINAMRLADAELELGLLSKEGKYARIQELTHANPVAVASRQDTLSQVKTAGMARMNKLATRIPRSFGKETSASHDFERIASDTEPTKESVDESVFDSQFFVR
jgi:hypothetical protein